jgi:hypothetical protein
MAEAGGAEEEKQILLGDAEFDMLALRVHPPALRAGELAVPKHVVAGMPVEHAAAVDPGAEIGGDRDIRAHGDDALREGGSFALGAADFREDLAEAGLRAHPPAGDSGLRQFVRHRDDGGGKPAPMWCERRRVRHAVYK